MLVPLLLLACGGSTVDTAASADTADTDTTAPPAWDAVAEVRPCDPAAPAELLDAAFANADLARTAFGTTRQEWNRWDSLVGDAFPLSWYLASHHDPLQAVCTAGQQQVDVDTAMRAAHPVAAAIGAFGRWADVADEPAPPDRRGRTLEQALAALVTATGGGDAPARASELPPEVAAQLAPVVDAIAEAITARRAMDAEIDAARRRTLARVFREGSGTVLGGNAFPDIRDTEELAWFTTWYLGASGPRQLGVYARRIAFAVESMDRAALATADLGWTFATPAGALRISPRTNDVHGPDAGWTLLHLELGGDDTYTGAAGATEDLDNPVSVLVDLGGTDSYGYDVVSDPDDAAGLLPSDAAGRVSRGGYPASASTTARQGAGRYGIGMLLDLGSEGDTYASLRASQGYGAMGVGVLYDAGGDDTYAGEAGVQGSGVFGLGLLLDAGGNDQYRAWAFAQGFGYVGSGGLLYDGGDGDDVYFSDPGNNYGGTTLYQSAQLAGGEGNSSFTQGAGFGMRADAYNVHLAGGFGMLQDGGGDDAYTAAVFAQGTGYWQGTGLLADEAGNDSYDALWYVQGGAAHFALGLLLDGAGDDRYNPNFRPLNVHLGSGHDFSVGLFVDHAGNDSYRWTTLAAGASNCQGVGLFADLDGVDAYEALSSYAVGLGNHSGECDEATGRTRSAGSEGIFVDGGGDADTWIWPVDDARAPGNDTTFGIAWAGTPDEHGGAVDGDGAVGIWGSL